MTETITVTILAVIIAYTLDTGRREEEALRQRAIQMQNEVDIATGAV